MKTTSMLVISMLALHVASAETRVWTDSDGTKLEAELVEYINGTVTLQAADEKQIQVGISSLSSEDQKVVLRSTPPDLDIHLKDSTDTENIGGGRNFDLDRTTYEFSLELEKEGSREYADTMTAEIYIIGYNRIQDKYIVLRKYEKPFSFANTSDDEIEIPLGRLSLTERGGNIKPVRNMKVLSLF